MVTVGALFGHSVPSSYPKESRSVAHPSRVGIEVELENIHTSSSPEGWRNIPDGSLRNHGAEFVFSGGAGGTGLVTRLKKLDQFLKKQTSAPEVTERCSVHVHLDVREMSIPQVKALISLYVAVEPFMFWVCGDHRADNIYCPAVYMAKEQLTSLAGLIELEGDRFRAHASSSSSFPKYTCLNVGSMAQHGTVEFRGHEGTLDTNQILRWTNCILSLKGFILQSSLDSGGVYDLCSRHDPREVLAIIFGELAEGVPDRALDRMDDSVCNLGKMLRMKDIKKSFETLPKKSGGVSLKFIEKYGIRWEPLQDLSSDKRYRLSPWVREIDGAYRRDFDADIVTRVLRVVSGRPWTSVPKAEMRSILQSVIEQRG